ncbi:DUF3618 domain-containing protein [Teichococcus aestuarii]|uniref:DUF3618 domain-containing protein n=1 Tax=Teichococcus aestuarii TaxID=568898 RepID=A0A2U1V6D9_9PROT|nr:DUF3618 domain-containing protein [Pseudoroseomonas aestuarii]PWC29431.1 hypothetical protein CR165_05615 [Pseudoroseomonas aestuarii]
MSHTNDQTTDPRGQSAAEIESDVERTRARVNETIEALRGSMAPGQLVEQALDYARNAGGAQFARNLGQAVRDNPLPVLMIGAGIGWLIMSGRDGGAPRSSHYMPPPRDLSPPRQPALPAPTVTTTSASSHGTSSGPSAPGLGSRLGDAVAGAKESVKDAAASIGQTASDMTDRVSSTAGSAGDRARMYQHDARDAASHHYNRLAEGTGHLGRQAGENWNRITTEQPLLIGALGLAVGAALGALLPRTETEDRLMGEASEATARQLRETAETQYEQAKDAVTTQAQGIGQALAETYEHGKEKLKEQGGGTVSATGGAVEQAVRGTGTGTGAGTGTGPGTGSGTGVAGSSSSGTAHKDASTSTTLGQR